MNEDAILGGAVMTYTIWFEAKREVPADTTESTYYGLHVDFTEEQEKRLRASYESGENFYINEDMDMEDIVDMLTELAWECLQGDDDFKGLDLSECIGEFDYPEEWQKVK